MQPSGFHMGDTVDSASGTPEQELLRKYHMPLTQRRALDVSVRSAATLQSTCVPNDTRHQSLMEESISNPQKFLEEATPGGRLRTVVYSTSVPIEP